MSSGTCTQQHMPSAGQISAKDTVLPTISMLPAQVEPTKARTCQALQTVHAQASNRCIASYRFAPARHDGTCPANTNCPSTKSFTVSGQADRQPVESTLSCQSSRACHAGGSSMRINIT
jgi:hypothetical protein